MVINVEMLLIHTRTVNFVNMVRVLLHAMAISSASRCRVENSSSQIRIGEQAVQNMDN